MPYYNNQNYGGTNSFTQPSTNIGSSVSNPMVVNVNGDEGAKNYPVAAGNTVFLVDFNTNQFWIKSTSQNGLPEQFRSFSFEEKTPKVQIPYQDYVTKQELNDLKEYLDGQFTGIRNQIYNQKRERGQVNDKSNIK